MHPVPEAQCATHCGGPLAEVADDVGHCRQHVGPHQVHVSSGSRSCPGVVGQATEVQRRAASGHCGDAGGIHREVDELAVVVNAIAIKQRAQHLHHFQGAAVARRGIQGFAGHG